MASKYTVTLNRDVETVIHFNSVAVTEAGMKEIGGYDTPFTVKAGPRCFKTMKRAKAFIAAWRAGHGQDVCSDVISGR